jgi:tetratricopeptide (TPR) repeat protein
LLIAALALGAGTAFASSRIVPQPEPPEYYIRKMIAEAAKGSVIEATTISNKGLQRHPESIEMNYWTGAANIMQITVDPFNSSRDKQIIKHMKKTLDLIDKRATRTIRGKRTRKLSPYLMMYEGMAHSGLAMIYGQRGNYYKGGNHALRSARLLKKAIKQDPGLYDAYHFLGAYYYVASALPDWIRWILNVLGIPTGNRDVGIDMLKKARDHGKWTPVLAGSFLLYMFTSADENVELGRESVNWCKKNLPAENPLPAFGEMKVLQVQNQHEKAIEAANKLHAKTETLPGIWKHSLRNIARLGKLRSLVFLNRLDPAEKLIEELLKEKKGPPRQFWKMLHLEVGRYHDARGNRPEAIRAYNIALKYKGLHRIPVHAKKCISTPFKPIKNQTTLL